MKSIGFMGFGAIGATIGAQMLNKGIGIKVIVDDGRLARYKQDGVTVNGKVYHFDVETPKTCTGTLDVILVSVKYNQLHEAAELMKPFVGEETVMVSLLNGIDSEDILATYYPEKQIVHAFVVAIDALRVGNEITYTNKGKIIYGAGFSTAVEALPLVEDALSQGEIAFECQSDILKELWWKYLVNVGINQVSAILKGPYGLFQTNDYARSLMFEAMDEVIEMSKAVGVPLDEHAVPKFLKILDTLGPDQKTSMLQDVDAKRITEVDMLAGKMIEMGKTYGVPVPMNTILFKMLKALEATF